MDAIALLTADHNRFRGLFTRFEESVEQDDTEAMTELAQEIATELDVHTTIEEELFYPAMRQLDELDSVVAEGLEEHSVAKSLLEQIRDGNPRSEEWPAKMKVLIENVEHHVEEEETGMFLSARRQLDKAALIELSEVMERRKSELGAAISKDMDGLSTTELRRRASEQQIPGRSSMNREELASTIGLDK